ncbi:MAG: ester cyclase [Chloroflexi bacterium]|nr:ester cyclase [Chloroflexota bacterium]
MSEQNKRISRRLIEEGFDKGNLSVVDEVCADNYVNHDAPPGLPPAREGIKAFINMYRTAFPDLRSTIDEQIAEGDRVVTRWSAQGTNKGNLFGMPPTGKRMNISGHVIDRIVGGKIVETWNTFDQLGLMQQLGVIPAAASPGAQATKPAGRPETGRSKPGAGAPV